MKWVIASCGVLLVASFTFTYVAINAICDDDYWPDWA
jgi:hypothetical protein